MMQKIADQAEIVTPETKKTRKKGKAEAKPSEKKKVKVVHTLGKRKSAVARATALAGTGKVLLNAKPIALLEPEMARLRAMEPLILAGDAAKNIDISVNVKGGGTMGQMDAARQAIALALVGFDRKLKSQFLDYDRTLLVADARRNEPHKPSRSKAGPRRHKQRSKR